MQGALLGALVTLVLIGAVSFGFGSRVISGRTVYKLFQLRGLIDETYLGETEAEDLEEGIYKGYLEALSTFTKPLPNHY